MEKSSQAPYLKIALIASEGTPFIKTGGLADVVGALPIVLRKLGHDAIVILPKYAAIDHLRFELQPFLSPVGVWMGNGIEWCAVFHCEHSGVPVYFIESHKYFDRWGLYHDGEYNDYLDNPRRFGFFTRAALQLCRDMGFDADIVHAHDWMTALAPAYLKIWHWDDPILGHAASVLTIHNIAYQGVYPAEHYDYLGLQLGNFSPDKFEDHGAINMLKGGIQFADMVNTVSPTYANETRTPAGGMGLAPYLNDRGADYLGILNGVEYAIWNPEEDPFIPAKYSNDDLSGKSICKRELQERMLLEVNPNTPLIGVVSRFAHQKGLDLLADALDQILTNMNVQFVILGAGEPDLERFYGEIPARFPGRVSSFIGYNNELSHWIEAGSDFLIMPSRFEPCGLNQMYSLRYGTLPIVRATGGLNDTVWQYDETTGVGTGFKFWEPSSHAVYYAVGWAVSTYYDRPAHMSEMIQIAMAQEFSWERSAEGYLEIYRRALANKRALA
jgi:starch synthase